MNIDWSKAPEGTTGAMVANFDSTKKGGKTTIGKVEWIPSGDDYVSYAQGKYAWSYHARPDQWTGEGLPPVGTVCEFEMALAGWVPATITAVTKKSIIFTRPLFKNRTGLDYENTHEEMLPHHAAKRLRPVRTPDQIAAEEREKGILQMAADAGHWWKDCPFDQLPPVLAVIYDAGYRKFEIVEN